VICAKAGVAATSHKKQQKPNEVFIVRIQSTVPS